MTRAILMTFLLSGLFLWTLGCTNDASDPPLGQANPTKVVNASEITVSQITKREVQRTVPAIGSFTGFEDISVTPKITGNVVNIAVQLGDIVHPGDLLLEVDPTDYQLEYNQIYRSIEAEAARLGVTVSERILTLPELQKEMIKFEQLTIDDLPSVAQALEQEKNAKSQLDRGQTLLPGRTITQQEFETLQKEYNVAKQSLDQARFDATAAVSTVRQRFALLSAAWQKLVDAKVVVPYSSISAAQFGDQVEYRVAKRNVHEGELVRGGVGMVGGGSAVFELVIDSVLKYIAMVPERFQAEVAVGQSVSCRVESYPDEIFVGTVSRVSPQIEPANRTFEVEVLFQNPDRKLTPGGFARGSIAVRTDPDAITVPVNAVLTTVGTHKVFVLKTLPKTAEENTTVEPVIVQTGEEISVVDPVTDKRENWIEVTPVEGEKAMEPGMWVAVTNLGSLYQESPVHLRATEESKNLENSGNMVAGIAAGDVVQADSARIPERQEPDVQK